MFPLKIVKQIHEEIIKTTGGTFGLRDEKILESSLKQPFQTFENKELYPSVEEKSAKLLELLIKNHPFVDGNKRVAYVLFRLFLEINGYKISASEEEKYEFIMSIASGKLTYKEIVLWIKNHIVKL